VTKAASAAVANARVVADHVEPAVGGNGILNHLARLVGVGEIDRRDASHLTVGTTYELSFFLNQHNAGTAVRRVTAGRRSFH
jgi:hypothetical protein